MPLGRLKTLVKRTPLERPARAIFQLLLGISQDDQRPAGQFRPETRTSVSLPDGVSLEDLRSAFMSFSLDGGPVGQLDPYVHDALHRFINSWNVVRNETGNCLELGANPYFITWLLREHTDLDLTLANYFGGEEGVGRQTLSWETVSGRRESILDFDHFNSEESPFPYPDDTFDVVVYCEIIEHLLMNPVHTLKEIHRVLKPGGLLHVTTPNVARFGNIIAIAEGRSIYDPYSGFGPYGRHNREYSMPELLRLLEFCGFSHETSFTADAHDEDWSGHPLYEEACRIASHRPHHLGQYLFAGVRATGTPREGLPGTLFRSYEGDVIDSDW